MRKFCSKKSWVSFLLIGLLGAIMLSCNSKDNDVVVTIVRYEVKGDFTGELKVERSLDGDQEKSTNENNINTLPYKIDHKIYGKFKTSLKVTANTIGVAGEKIVVTIYINDFVVKTETVTVDTNGKFPTVSLNHNNY